MGSCALENETLPTSLVVGVVGQGRWLERLPSRCIAKTPGRCRGGSGGWAARPPSTRRGGDLQRLKGEDKMARRVLLRVGVEDMWLKSTPRGTAIQSNPIQSNPVLSHPIPRGTAHPHPLR